MRKQLGLLAIFDIDGTICDSQEAEGRCFSLAIERVTGRALSSIDWAKYVEPTASAIVRDVLAEDPDAEGKENLIMEEFCRLLKEARTHFPGDFSPLPGAVDFLQRLASEHICTVAIASGCFETDARFKLDCCGVCLGLYPHATSTDTPSRRNILALAAERAGFGLSSVVYFADGPWDVRVSNTLGISMIGIGRRWQELKSLGVRHAFRDYTDAGAIIDALMMGK